MPTYESRDGQHWEPATPVPVQGFIGKAEAWARRRGYRRLSTLLAWWDERGLGS